MQKKKTVLSFSMKFQVSLIFRQVSIDYFKTRERERKKGDMSLAILAQIFSLYST